MNIKEIIYTSDSKKIDAFLAEILSEIHKNGPVSQSTLEKISYIKKFHASLFSKYESTLIYLLGLFYKTNEPENLIEEIYSIISDSIQEDTGYRFTPVQANAYITIKNHKYFSFSAPTSTGKSFLFHQLIKETKKDLVIVVPSRALIAEYIFKLKNLFKNDKTILILQFFENVNIKHSSRRIFVVTPERGKDLFDKNKDFNIDLFLFDEAQISEEEIRGLTFDAFVRRIDKVFPSSKKVFTHPFIENPEAQLHKHNFNSSEKANNYNQLSVGKIYISKLNGNKYFYFSPDKPDEKIEFKNDIQSEILNSGGTILVYISKSKIYDKSYLESYSNLIKLCNPIENPEALEIIEELRDYIGASKLTKVKHSILIDLMLRGIVIHHGSIPLRGRLLIEKFVNKNFAKICFATSTLIQGINMPFDAVVIENFKFDAKTEDLKTLSLKNLIGRAGRITEEINKFDYGYVIINNSNLKTFCKRLHSESYLSNNSKLEEDTNLINEDQKDLVEAIKNNSFNDELNLTNSQVERIEKANLDDDIKYILDLLVIDKRIITGDEYYKIKPKAKREKIKDSFKKIFISHLRRNDLSRGEQRILSTAIPIMLWKIQGKSFKEIISLRYAFLTRKSELRHIKIQLLLQKISRKEFNKKNNELTVINSIMASTIPKVNVSTKSLFGNVKISKLEYDLLVYDTYDYIDKVIDLSLKDPICATFKIYFDKTNDIRAQYLINYIKYGTNNNSEIWLLKYGFSFDEIDKIRNYVVQIDENEILFKPFVENLRDGIFELIERYIY